MMKTSLSVAELDAFDCCAVYPEIRAKLLAADGDPTSAFTWQMMHHAGVRFTDIRDPLYPLARLAQTDPEMWALLTRLINDCQIQSLDAFESAWPGDNRPRAAIEATRRMLDGKLDRETWRNATDSGLRALAGYLAPEPLIANGMWASVERRSWQLLDDSELDGWKGWARWAVLALKAHLVCEETRKGLDLSNEAAASDWALERLSEYLEGEPVAELPMPPPSAKSGSGPFSRAKKVRSMELEWPYLTVFPDGVEYFEGAHLDKNAFLALAPTIREIGSLSCYLAEIHVPGSVRRIEYLSVEESDITFEDGLATIGTIHVPSFSNVDLPSTLKTIDCVQLDGDLVIPDSVAYIGKIELYDETARDAEDNIELAVVHRGNRYKVSAKPLRLDKDVTELLP